MNLTSNLTSNIYKLIILIPPRIYILQSFLQAVLLAIWIPICKIFRLMSILVELKVVPNISVRPNWNGPFHLISNRNFRKFGLYGKRPKWPMFLFQNLTRQYQMSVHHNMNQLFQVYQMPNLPTILNGPALPNVTAIRFSHAGSKVQVTFHRSRVQVTPPSIYYQTTQIPLDLIEHFV